MARWTYVNKFEVTGGSTDTLSITGLDGATDEVYRIVFSLIHSNPGTTRDFQFRPNSVTTNDGSQYLANSGSADTNSWRIAGSVRDFFRGFFELRAAINPRGSSVNHVRSYYAEFAQGDVASVSTSAIWVVRSAGIWSETSTAVSGLDIVTCTSGTDTKATGLANGSIAELWKRSA